MREGGKGNNLFRKNILMKFGKCKKASFVSTPSNTGHSETRYSGSKNPQP
jgi:hypothetical protein